MDRFGIKKSEGFTIVELLIVIVVIGVLTAIGIVTYNTFASKAQDARSASHFQQINKSIEIHKVRSGRAVCPTCTSAYGFVNEYGLSEALEREIQFSSVHDMSTFSSDHYDRQKIQVVAKDPSQLYVAYWSHANSAWMMNAYSEFAGYYQVYNYSSSPGLTPVDF